MLYELFFINKKYFFMLLWNWITLDIQSFVECEFEKENTNTDHYFEELIM